MSKHHVFLIDSSLYNAWLFDNPMFCLKHLRVPPFFWRAVGGTPTQTQIYSSFPFFLPLCLLFSSPLCLLLGVSLSLTLSWSCLCFRFFIFSFSLVYGIESFELMRFSLCFFMLGFLICYGDGYAGKTGIASLMSSESSIHLSSICPVSLFLLCPCVVHVFLSIFRSVSLSSFSSLRIFFFFPARVILCVLCSVWLYMQGDVLARTVVKYVVVC